MCPFCYIGKKKFDTALAQFPHSDKIEIVWKSFQLMPDLETVPGKSINEVLSDAKGISPAQAAGMNAQVTQLAQQAGLTFNLEQSVPANTFNAHRFARFAQTRGLQPEAEEALFEAYFTDGKNIDDVTVLVQLGTGIGLDGHALRAALESDSYAQDVQKDIAEAGQLGIRGVPFFVFDRKQAVSGAQEPATFLQVLETTFSEWQHNNPAGLQVIAGQSCSTDGTCN